MTPPVAEYPKREAALARRLRLRYLPNGVNTPFWIGVIGVHAMEGQTPKVGHIPTTVNCGIVGVKVWPPH
jgi:hypothetical protein